MGGPNNQGGWTNFQNLIKMGVKINVESEFKKRLKMVIKQWKEQKQAVIKGKAKI